MKNVRVSNPFFHRKAGERVWAGELGRPRQWRVRGILIRRLRDGERLRNLRYRVTDPQV